MTPGAVIGLVVPALTAGGGVPSVARFLCEQIDRTGRYRLEIFSLASSARDEHSLRLLAPSTWSGYPRTAMGVWEGRGITHVGAVGVELEFQRYRPSHVLERALRGCDLIQVVAGSPAVALTVARCRQPVVLQVATRAVVERARTLSTGRAPLLWWRRGMARITDRLDDAALRRVDAVVVENEWMRVYAGKIAGAATIVLKATPGVDCERFIPAADRGSNWPQAPYILFVGRLSDPRKNVTLLCRAYSRLCTSMATPPRLIIAGSGELPPAALQEIQSLAAPERVTIVRSPDNERLRHLYQGAACLAVPSTEEGFGLVVIEAMASGIPVVSTRCGGPDEIISHGLDGYLVALEDAADLAHHLALLCADVESNIRFGLQARATALTRYADGAAFSPFLQTYDRLLRHTQERGSDYNRPS